MRLSGKDEKSEWVKKEQTIETEKQNVQIWEKFKKRNDLMDPALLQHLGRREEQTIDKR